MYKLKIITSTVRPGRKGPIISNWVAKTARKNENFEVEILDLGEINLPLMNEPVHPILKQYEHDHTKQWSQKIEEADAFIFVTAEYDYSYPASLKNALEYLVHEWAYKPAGLVSYSAGAFAGVRAVMSLKTDLLSLRTIALAETVNIPLVNQLINEDGVFIPNETITSQAIQCSHNWCAGRKGLKR